MKRWVQPASVFKILCYLLPFIQDHVSKLTWVKGTQAVCYELGWITQNSC